MTSKNNYCKILSCDEIQSAKSKPRQGIEIKQNGSPLGTECGPDIRRVFFKGADQRIKMEEIS